MAEETPQQEMKATPQMNNYQNATPLASLQQMPTVVDCPACGMREMTSPAFVNGSRTHLAALLCCCCFCLGCVPYLTNWFKDVEHKCGSCGTPLAVWHRGGETEVLAHRAT